MSVKRIKFIPTSQCKLQEDPQFLMTHCHETSTGGEMSGYHGTSICAEMSGYQHPQVSDWDQASGSEIF